MACECGCGESVPPGRRFIHGHNARLQEKVPRQPRKEWEALGIPYGLCLCGCGERTSLAVQGDRRLGYAVGEPVFYVRGHATRKRVQYVKEDRGYETPCWIWQLWTTHDGYGKMADGTGTQRMAHRVMWERIHGPIPKGHHLDHLCRVRSCVNPEHMEPVTPALNTQRSATAKLNWPQVREIRAELARGISQSALARRYDVSVTAIWMIAHGRHWRE